MTTHPTHTTAHAKAEAAAAAAESPPEPEAPPEPLKAGDIVTLNVEGSPHMMVADVANNGFDIRCRWFGKDDTLHEQVFHTSELTLVPHKKKGK